MSAIHELSEDYRVYRIENPSLRWLFLLGDVASALIKLAVVCAFAYMCWYLVSRSPQVGDSIAAAGETNPPLSLEVEAPELTAERIELLNQIAGQQGVTTELLGAFEDNPQPTEVKAMSAAAVANELAAANLADASENTEIADVTTASADLTPAPQPTTPTVEFTDEIFLPSSTENGSWVLQQNASHYTVQLGLTNNVEFLVNFASQLPDSYRPAIFPERENNSGVQYSLSAGSYANEQTAIAALAALSPTLKRYGAHVRAFGEIHSNTSKFVR